MISRRSPWLQGAVAEEVNGRVIQGTEGKVGLGGRCGCSNVYRVMKTAKNIEIEILCDVLWIESRFRSSGRAYLVENQWWAVTSTQTSRVTSKPSRPNFPLADSLHY